MSTDLDTVRSYDTVAAEYAAEAAAMPEWVATEIDAFVTSWARVLEIGSGGGRDALELEKRGIQRPAHRHFKGFRRTASRKWLRGRPVGPADRRLGRPAASRHAVRRDLGLCLPEFHVAREDFGTVLGRLAEATRTGGRLHASVREGEGEDVSTHGSAAAPRRYVETYWREVCPAVRTAQTPAGSSARYVGASESPMIGG